MGYFLFCGQSPLGKDCPYLRNSCQTSGVCDQVTKEPILLVRYFEKHVLFGWFYTFTALSTLNALKALIALLRLNWQNL